MMFKYFVAFALTAPILTTEASMPGLFSRDGTSALCKARLAKRDVYHGDENGNTKVTVSKHRINWGTTPPWDALDHWHKKCEDDETCPLKIDVPTQIVSGDDIHDATITMRLTQDLRQSKKMTKRLIEAAKAISAGHGNKHTYHVKKKKYHPNKTGCCPTVNCCICDVGDPETADQYIQTNVISIIFRDQDHDVHGQMEIRTSVSLNIDGDDEMCENLAIIGSAVAGAVSGIAGGFFTLLSLTC
ncbi:hypothetical protein FSARC_767 [Fusarium sarcochroum]|uniref:Uncharacterized protein n=1 Tax=Fusarium sarcochroum TaxID=1208366 RepID=A0A8H4UAY2_9HYPO|nr:hypothetical protein FSARC_767 [Fusarium sarcochroum]